MSEEHDVSCPGQYPDVLPRGERLSSLLYAGIWLVFLAWPILNIFLSETGLVWKLLSTALLLGFGAIYLLSFAVARPFPKLPRWFNTLLYSLVLVLLIALASFSAGESVLSLAPFFIAVWLFNHPLRLALPVSVFILTATAIGLFWANSTSAPYIAGSMAIALIIMLGIYISTEREESARLLHQDLRLARQRESFARDVHDVLGHSLTVISVKAELAKRLIETDPGRAASELEDVQRMARQSLGEVRATIEHLRSPRLGDQLAAARTALDAAGIEAELPGRDALTGIPASHQEVLAWCLREAVTNVVRHADAIRCTIRLAPDRLTITDDGVGPDHRADHPAGKGIEGMRSRVAEISGMVSITPARPGNDRPGTRVEVRL